MHKNKYVFADGGHATLMDCTQQNKLRYKIEEKLQTIIYLIA